MQIPESVRSIYYGKMEIGLRMFKDAFDWISQFTNSEKQITDDEMIYPLTVNTDSIEVQSECLHYLINYYPYPYTEEQLLKLISHGSFVNIQEIPNILKRDEVTPRVIDEVITQYEKVNDFGSFIIENNVSNKVLNYLIENYEKDMKKWHYAPYLKCNTGNVHAKVAKLLDTDNYNEELMLAIVNNEAFGEIARNKAFDNGCDISKITNPTKYMVDTIYASTADYLFEIEHTAKDLNKMYDIEQMIRKIIPYLDKTRSIDLINRINEAKRHSILLKDLSKNIKDEDVAYELIECDKMAIKNLVFQNAQPTNEMFDKIKEFMTTNEKIKFCIRALLEYEIAPRSMYDYLFNTINKEEQKVILLSPRVPNYILDKMKKDANLETKIMIEIRQNLKPFMFTSEKYFWIYQKMVMDTMNKDSDLYSFIYAKTAKPKRLLCADTTAAEHFFSIYNKIISNHKKEKGLRVFQYETDNLKSTYDLEKPLLGNAIPFFETSSGIINYHADLVAKASNSDIENAIEKIKKIDNPSVLYEIKNYITNELSDDKYDANPLSRAYYAFKSERLFMAAEEKMRELKHSNPSKDTDFEKI